VRVPDQEPQEALESRQDKADEAKVQAQVEDHKAKDPVSEPIEYGQFVQSQSISQCFGQAAIDYYRGDADAMPRWRFSRRYLGRKIIVDLFYTQRAYDNAQVEQRRALCKHFGYAYAALGPAHSVYPHPDPEMRKKMPPSQVEQLGLE
jgi:hypothetical protein